MGTAHREATTTSHREGCAVAIEVQQRNERWKRRRVIQPPKSLDKLNPDGLESGLRASAKNRRVK
jgi:hypothetical protein